MPVGSFSSCPVLVAHHMSASGLRMTRQVSEAVDALARGWGQAETSGALTLLVFLAGFFVRSEGRFFVPTCPLAVTPRADALRAGGRVVVFASSSFARPRLDGGEHGVTLGVVGTCAISSPC